MVRQFRTGVRDKPIDNAQITPELSSKFDWDKHPEHAVVVIFLAELQLIGGYEDMLTSTDAYIRYVFFRKSNLTTRNTAKINIVILIKHDYERAK